MSDLSIIATVVYKSKKTGETWDIKFAVTGIEQAKLIAEIFRRKGVKIVSVTVEYKHSLI